MRGSDNRRMPPMLDLDMVAVELGFKDYPKASQLNAISQFSRQGLVLTASCFFYVYAVETSEDLEQEDFGDDEYGNPELGEQYFAGEADQHNFGTFTIGSCVFRSTTLDIYTAINNGIEYFILRDDGRTLDCISVPLGTVYVRRDDLKIFMSNEIDEDLPTYANPESPFYAPNLVEAIEAHDRYIVNWDGNPHFGVERRLKEVNKEYYFTESKTGTVLNAVGKRTRAMLGQKRTEGSG